jgi:AraC family transcriptional regulator of arabinose operon
MRDQYLLHYIHSGKGTYHCSGRSYQLGAGHSFLLFPGVPGSYQADPYDPWTYSWVAFAGEELSHYLDLAGLTTGNPIYQHTEADALEAHMAELIAYGAVPSAGSQLHAVGILYRLLASMVENSTIGQLPPYTSSNLSKSWYLDKALAYLQTHYALPGLTVSSLAKHVGLERSYFAKLFADELHQTPYQFLLRYRLEKASRLLTHTDLPIADVAAAAGFQDPLYFTKVFRKHIGRSPSDFRKHGVKR